MELRDTMTNCKRLRVILHLLAGGLMILISVMADIILGQHFIWGPKKSLFLVIGIGIVTIGFMHRHEGVISRVSTNLCLSLLSIFMFLAVLEGFFRGIGFDFVHEEQAWRQIPIYFRLPNIPTGDIFFRRPGPEQWTGQVLNTRLKQLGILPNPYMNEPVITVEYDSRGFRNSEHLSDWTIAVAGDSFTELGCIVNEQLFTSILSRILNISVLNLGASYTGPLTQLSYLRDYGISANTKHTIIVFFEGNDLEDLAEEYNALVLWRETGQRNYRNFSKQPSLARALKRFVGRIWPSQLNYVTAYFKSSQGDIPVSLHYTPPGRDQLTKETMQHLNYFFKQYREFGKEQQITVWLAYMPCKLRVFYHQIEFSACATEDLKNWQPSDLPEVISAFCDQYGIKFIDLTPVLIRETNLNKQLLYNTIYDTHLNSNGSLVVGQELASQFLRQNGLDYRYGYNQVSPPEERKTLGN